MLFRSGPDLDGGENPGRLLFTLKDRSDFIGLKFRRPEAGDFLIVEAATAVTGFVQPAIDRIPADAFDAGDGDLFKPSTLSAAT